MHSRRRYLKWSIDDIVSVECVGPKPSDDILAFNQASISTNRPLELWDENKIHALVARLVDSGKVVGLLPLEEKSLWHPYWNESVELHWISGFEVAPELRGMGLGAKLIKAASSIYGPLGVFCDPGRRVYGFYSSCGFRSVASICGIDIPKRDLVRSFDLFGHLSQGVRSHLSPVTELISKQTSVVAIKQQHIYRESYLYEEYGSCNCDGFLFGVRREPLQVYETLIQGKWEREIEDLANYIDERMEFHGIDSFRVYAHQDESNQIMDITSASLGFNFHVMVTANHPIISESKLHYSHISYV